MTTPDLQIAYRDVAYRLMVAHGAVANHASPGYPDYGQGPISWEMYGGTFEANVDASRRLAALLLEGNTPDLYISSTPKSGSGSTFVGTEEQNTYTGYLWGDLVTPSARFREEETFRVALIMPEFRTADLMLTLISSDVPSWSEAGLRLQERLADHDGRYLSHNSYLRPTPSEQY